MRAFSTAVKKFAQDEEGITAIEYGLLAALVVSAVVAGFTTLGSNLKTLLENIGSNLVLTT